MSLLAFLVYIMHQLDITYHNTFNCLSLRIEDNSIYEDNLPVKNAILEIKAPGAKNYITFTFPNKKWKAITVNCSSLKLCCTKQPCKFTSLPDGVYDLKYSIDPNLKTIIEFSHMRVCKIMSNYIKLIGLYFSNRHSYTKKENELFEKEFLDVNELIVNSVYAVEELSDITLGLELYEEAALRIKTIYNGNFTRCC